MVDENNSKSLVEFFLGLGKQNVIVRGSEGGGSDESIVVKTTMLMKCSIPFMCESNII